MRGESREVAIVQDSVDRILELPSQGMSVLAPHPWGLDVRIRRPTWRCLSAIACASWTCLLRALRTPWLRLVMVLLESSRLFTRRRSWLRGLLAPQSISGGADGPPQLAPSRRALQLTLCLPRNPKEGQARVLDC